MSYNFIHFHLISYNFLYILRVHFSCRTMPYTFYKFLAVSFNFLYFFTFSDNLMQSFTIMCKCSCDFYQFILIYCNFLHFWLSSTVSYNFSHVLPIFLQLLAVSSSFCRLLTIFWTLLPFLSSLYNFLQCLIYSNNFFYYNSLHLLDSSFKNDFLKFILTFGRLANI